MPNLPLILPNKPDCMMELQVVILMHMYCQLDKLLGQLTLLLDQYILLILVDGQNQSPPPPYTSQFSRRNVLVKTLFPVLVFPLS